jgi:hypothetical protein
MIDSKFKQTHNGCWSGKVYKNNNPPKIQLKNEIIFIWMQET